MTVTDTEKLRWPFLVACVLAAAFVAAAYSNHFDNGFHFDDSHVIVNNPSIRSLSNPARYFMDANTFSSFPENATYRPLLSLSFAIDYRLGGGLEPRAFHTTQFGLLLLLGVLLAVFFKRLCDHGQDSPWNRWIALFAATWFCVHTANTETVNYLSSRSSLVATLGVVVAFLVYIHWPRGRITGLYLLPVIVGGLAKPLTVVFAPLLLAYVYLFEEGGTVSDLRVPEGRRTLGMAVVRCLPAFAVGLVLFVFLTHMDSEAARYAEISRWRYLLTQPFVWVHYLRLFVLPIGLTADTDWPLVDHWFDTRLFAGLIVLLILAAASWTLSRTTRSRPAAFGLMWFAIALLPTSSLFPLSEVYNEHRIFFPYVGLTFATSWLGGLWASRSQTPRASVYTAALLAVAILASHGLGTYHRNRVWKDDTSLWADVVEKSPRNGRGLMNYGLTLMGQGYVRNALTYFERARQLTPNYSILEVNLAIAKASLGDQEAAESHFQRALQLNPKYGGGRSYYGRWLVEGGRAEEGLEQLVKAGQLAPSDPMPQMLLARLYAALGADTDLSALTRRMLALNPTDTTAMALVEGRLPFPVMEESSEAYAALALRKIGQEQWIDAAMLYQRAHAMGQDDAMSWNNLGWALLQLGFHQHSVPCFERAVELDPDLEVAEENRKWALQLVLSEKEPGP